MKLATYKDGSRDGHLLVVSRDLSSAHYANGIAGRLQQVLDDWNFMSPQLEDLYTTLNQGKARHAFAFDPALCMAPLPRAYQWVVAAAYGTDPPAAGPLLTRAAGDDLHGPRDDAVFDIADEGPETGIDCEPGLAVVSGDLPMGASPAQGLDAVRLLMLANDWRLRTAATDPGPPLADRPATAFSPVAVTPDELGPAWRGGRVHLELTIARNGQPPQRLATGPAMGWHFGQWLALLARRRRLGAGTILGTGPVGLRAAAENAESGWPPLQIGDRVCIEMKGGDGADLFGAIEQTVSDPA